MTDEAILQELMEIEIEFLALFDTLDRRLRRLEGRDDN